MPLIKYRPAGLGRGGGRKGRGEGTPLPRAPPMGVAWEQGGLPDRLPPESHSEPGPQVCFPRGCYLSGFCPGSFYVVASQVRPQEKTPERLRKTKCVPLPGPRNGRQGPVGKHLAVGAAGEEGGGAWALSAFLPETRQGGQSGWRRVGYRTHFRGL